MFLIRMIFNIFGVDGFMMELFENDDLLTVHGLEKSQKKNTINFVDSFASTVAYTYYVLIAQLTARRWRFFL